MAVKAYISGPISKDLDGYKEKFAEAAKVVENCGCVPLNPAILPQGMSQHDYMRICMAMLDVSDLIIMLDGWEDSEGAVIERKYAKKIGLPCYSLEEAKRIDKSVDFVAQQLPAIFNLPQDWMSRCD